MGTGTKNLKAMFIRIKSIRTIQLATLLFLWGLPNVMTAQDVYTFKMPGSNCEFPVQAPNCSRVEIKTKSKNVPVGGTFEFDVKIDGKFSDSNVNEFIGHALCGVRSLPNPHTVERSVNHGGPVYRYIGWHYPGPSNRDLPNPTVCWPDYGSVVKIKTQYMNEFGCITQRNIDGARTYRNNREFDYLKVNGAVTRASSVGGGTENILGKEVKIRDENNKVVYEGFWPGEVEIRKNGTGISTDDGTTRGPCNFPPNCPDAPQKSTNCLRYRIGGLDGGEWKTLCSQSGTPVPTVFVVDISASEQQFTFAIFDDASGRILGIEPLNGRREFPRVEQGYSTECANTQQGWRPIPVLEMANDTEMNMRCRWVTEGRNPTLRCSKCPEVADPITMVLDEVGQAVVGAGLVVLKACGNSGTNAENQNILTSLLCLAAGGGLAATGSALVLGGADALCGTSFETPVASRKADISSSAGVEETLLEKRRPSQNFISVFPNPTTDIFTLEMDATAGEEITVELYDMYGSHTIKAIFTVRGGSLQEKMDLGRLPSGIYIMTVNTSLGREFSSRLIVKE